MKKIFAYIRDPLLNIHHPHPILRGQSADRYAKYLIIIMCTGKHTAKTTLRLEELQDTESEDNSEAGTGPQQSTGKILFQ